MQEDFLLLDKSFQLRILVTELMIRISISNKNLDNKFKDIKKNYKSLLEEENHLREKIMIGLLSKKVHNEDIVEDKKKLLDYMSDSDSEDIDIISYNIWIKENIK
tara:strand:- start:187 stop:501 length:315 start_codon:yes stop_codon:yes gene_type:complete